MGRFRITGEVQYKLGIIPQACLGEPNYICPKTFGVRSPTPRKMLYSRMRRLSSGRSSPTFRNNVLPPSSAWFLLVTYLAYSSTMKMEAVRSSEKSVSCYWITQRKILHSHYRETFKYSLNKFIWLVLKMKHVNRQAQTLLCVNKILRNASIA
jgi:hypothetical protein